MALPHIYIGSGDPGFCNRRPPAHSGTIFVILKNNLTDSASKGSLARIVDG